MAILTPRTVLLTLLLGSLGLPQLSAQVFVVGEHSATADINVDFKPTRVPLSDEGLTERGRRDLIRMLEAEEGFAHMPLPIAPNLTLEANGHLSPNPDAYRRMIYEKGQAAAPGDRIVITAVSVHRDSLVMDLNGGPYAKHRFLRHLQINDAQVVGDPYEVATGSRVTLHFEGGVPEISAPEVKALLEPLIDFRVKTGEEAYADTLPDPIKDHIAAHEVLVGMNHRMVLAALGAPESKVREHSDSASSDSPQYEEWIYGHVPQTVRFVRFQGDRVTQVKIAELGKPIQIHTQDEMDGFNPPPPTREIAMGDRPPDSPDDNSAPPPTLRKDGETLPSTSGIGKVQMPSSGPSSGPSTPSTGGAQQPAASSSPGPSLH